MACHPEGTHILIPPDAINVQVSSLHQPLGDPYVMQALLFIRQYACQGIKTAQVAAYVGVSRSSLESHFRAVRGCSVHDEILRFKLAAAASGPENTDSRLQTLPALAVSNPHNICTRFSAASSDVHRVNISRVRDSDAGCVDCCEGGGVVSARSGRLALATYMEAISRWTPDRCIPSFLHWQTSIRFVPDRALSAF
jgi:AraC-like DNA-binding protein